MRLRTENGFSLIELLIVVGIIGIIAAIGIPLLMDAIDRSKQRRTMGDMHSISVANGTHMVDLQSYAPNLAALQAAQYIQVAVTQDGWGNPLEYQTNGTTYTLISRGSDGAAGPAPPVPWNNDPFDPDIMVADGMFTQSPEG